MLKYIVPGVLVVALVVLSWMSLLRVDNMAHDVARLRQEVDVLQQLAASRAGTTAPLPSPENAGPAQTPAPLRPAAGVVATPAPATTLAAANGRPQVYEATLQGFFTATSAGPQTINIPLPPGTAVPSAQVLVLAVEGEGSAPLPVPEPPAVTLVPGQPQTVTGLCQGPPGAGWVFTLQGSAVRVESRDCLYPVRGLKPHLRITVPPAL